MDPPLLQAKVFKINKISKNNIYVENGHKVVLKRFLNRNQEQTLWLSARK